MVFVLFDEPDVVFFFEPFSTVECQIWLERILDVKLCHPFRVKFANVKQDFVASALSNDKLLSDMLTNVIGSRLIHGFGHELLLHVHVLALVSKESCDISVFIPNEEIVTL